MRPWQLTVLVLCGCVLLLSLATVIYRVGDAADRSVEKTPGLFSSFSVALAAVAADTCTTQRRLVEAIERVSTAAAGAMDRTALAAERNLDRIGKRFSRLAGVMEGGVDRLSSEGSLALAEARMLLESTRLRTLPAVEQSVNETVRVMASARGLIDQARAELSGISGEVKTAVAGVRPLLDASTTLLGTVDGIAVQGEKIAESGANVAAHYEKMILHPSTGQKIKGWLQLFFSGVTVWANSKILF